MTGTRVLGIALAVSLVLLLLSARGDVATSHVPWEDLIRDEARLRQGLKDRWPFGDTHALSAPAFASDPGASHLLQFVDATASQGNFIGFALDNIQVHDWIV